VPRGVFPRRPGLKRKMPIRPLADRVMEKIRAEESGCWRWLGSLTKAGYGRVNLGTRETGIGLVHRVVYELHRGPIPVGLEIDHLCRNRWCCRPEHLQAVPHAVNSYRGVSPGMLIRLSGRCGRGHELTPENVYYRKDRPGAWNCRVCRRERRAAAGERERLRAGGC